jgi:predicted phosphodiesterase
MPGSEPITSSNEAFRFIVIADSHIRPPDQEVDAYPSNAFLVRRNEFIVDLCNRIDASFVVHLGDIVHPLPAEDTHGEAIELARGVYGEFRHPINFVAGNHDVGDKPNSFVAVPAVAEANYARYEDAWGPSFYSFDVGMCHFVVLDTQLLNSGLDREYRQRSWVEADLEEASSSNQRIFVFTHYPPFVRDPLENEHYDNLGEPGRSWFLDLLEGHGIEAVFSGHVHNFLYNRYEETDLYVAPSTGFVRPDYSELASVTPGAENGRDDPPKLGFFVVEVTENGHDVRPIRTFGSMDQTIALPVSPAVALDQRWESPLGVTLTHAWMAATDFPTAGLDAFTRKTVRNDAPLLALWEARIRAVRIPIADLWRPSGMQRVEDLARRGMRFTVFSAGVPDERTMETVAGAAKWIERWEMIVPLDQFGAAVDGLRRQAPMEVHMAISPIVPIGEPGATVHHFVSGGFSTRNDAMLEGLLAIDRDGVFDEIVLRIPDAEEIRRGVAEANAVAAATGRGAVVIVELPRGRESTVFGDDEVVALRVGDAARASAETPDAGLFLDGFIDHDRGYYPRHGLIDRSFNPRPALYRLIDAAFSSVR